MNQSTTARFSIWPVEGFYEVFTAGSLSINDNPVSFFTDSTGQFTVLYADEPKMIKYVTQKVDIIGEGYTQIALFIDPDVIGRISVTISGIELLSDADSDGAILTISSPDFSENLDITDDEPLWEHPPINLECAKTKEETTLLESVLLIENKIDNDNNNDRLEIAELLKDLLIGDSSIIDLVNKKWQIPTLYRPFDFRLDPTTQRHNSFHWVNVCKDDVPDIWRPAKNKLELLACPVIIIEGEYITIQDVLITCTYIRHRPNSSVVLTPNQQACLSIHDSNRQGNRGPIISQIEYIAVVVIFGIEDLVSAILA
jgi:hypothetical protein